MKFNASTFSTKGIRPVNEDSFIMGSVINEEASPYTNEKVSGSINGCEFFAVADGMGGHGSGEKASWFVVSNLLSFSKEVTQVDKESLTKKINDIHSKMANINNKMGSTLSGIIIQKEKCAFVNLGDSRVYRYRQGMFMQITEDDSLKSIIPDAPSNIITNGIGGGIKSINVHCRFSDKLVIPGDRFLICCDGVHGFLSDEEIEKFLVVKSAPEEITKQIIQAAISNLSNDNCTAVVVDFTE